MTDQTEKTLAQEKLNLEIQKLKAEKVKAELEIRELSRPPFFRAAFITVLGPALLSLFAAMMAIYFGTYSPQLAKLEKLSAELESRESDIANKNASIQALDDQISNLSTERAQQRQINDGLQAESKAIRQESADAKRLHGKLDQDLKILTASAIFEQASLERAEKERARLGGELVMAKFDAPYSILREGVVESQTIEDIIARMRNSFDSDAVYRENFRAFIERKRSDPHEKALALMLDYRVSDNMHAKRELEELARENPNIFPRSIEHFGTPSYPDMPFFRTLSIALNKQDVSHADRWLLIELFSKRLMNIDSSDRHQYLLEFSGDVAPTIGPPITSREEREHFLRLIELARDDFLAHKVQYFDSRSSGGSEILFQRCRIAFFAVAGKILADPSTSLNDRNQILSRIGVAGYAITNDWSRWTKDNENLIELWLEPRLETLRRMKDEDFQEAINTAVPTKVY